MRRKVTCVLLICATVAIMGVIFWFSSQPTAESFQQSRMFAGWLAEMLPVAEPEAFMEDIHHLLRKLAHFMLYAALGLCLSGIVRRKKGFQRCSWCFSLAFCLQHLMNIINVFHKDAHLE